MVLRRFTMVMDLPGLLRLDDWSIFTEFSGWTGVVTGTGATGGTARTLRASSGSDAGSTALIRTPRSLGWSAGNDNDDFNFDKRIVLHFSSSLAASTTNGISRFTFGKLDDDGIGELANKGFGLILRDQAVSGTVNDGTTHREVDLNTTFDSSADTVHRVTITSDGAGNIEWFIDGVSVGTSPECPTGTSTFKADTLQLESENGADASIQQMYIHNLKFYMEQ